jgi:hypothetical protein
MAACGAPSSSSHRISKRLLHNGTLLLTATVIVRRVTAALARLRSRLFVKSRCSRAQR